MSPMGLGRVKTKSDLVVMPSGRQIFALFCSPHDRRAQISGPGYTAVEFLHSRVKERPFSGAPRDVGFPSDSDEIDGVIGRRLVDS